MSSGHASDDDFESAGSEAEDSGEGGSLDEQVVEATGVGCDEGVGFDEGEGTGPDKSSRKLKEGGDEAMRGAVPPPPVLVHADAKEGGGLTQREEELGQEGGFERDVSGKVKDADEERASEKLHGKEGVEVKQDLSHELQPSSIAVKDEQHDDASSKQVQEDLPEQEMDRRVEVLCIGHILTNTCDVW